MFFVSLGEDITRRTLGYGIGVFWAVFLVSPFLCRSGLTNVPTAQTVRIRNRFDPAKRCFIDAFAIEGVAGGPSDAISWWRNKERLRNAI